MPTGGGHVRWGYHRLADQWVERLVAESGIGRGDLVLDIGAGAGAVTAALVDAGARVVAVELHPGRVAALRRRFDHHDVRVVRADATDLRLPTQPFSVVANLPFASCDPILRRLLWRGSRLTRAEVIVPSRIATRWSTGRAAGAARWMRDFDLVIQAAVPRGAFDPPPRRAAAWLRVARRGFPSGR